MDTATVYFNGIYVCSIRAPEGKVILYGSCIHYVTDYDSELDFILLMVLVMKCRQNEATKSKMKEILSFKTHGTKWAQ